MEDLTDADEFPTVIQMPEGGEIASASLLRDQAIQRLSNRTRYCYNRILTAHTVLLAPGASSFSKPSWVKDETPVTLQQIGGGGGGGGGGGVGGTLDIAYGGGGGGSGMCRTMRLTGLDFNDSTNYFIGAGGSGGVGDQDNSTAGLYGGTTGVILAFRTLIVYGGGGGGAYVTGSDTLGAGNGGSGFHGGGGGGNNATIEYAEYLASRENGGRAAGGIPGERGRSGNEYNGADLRRGGDGGNASFDQMGPMPATDALSGSGHGGISTHSRGAGGGGGAPGVFPLFVRHAPVSAMVEITPSVAATAGGHGDTLGELAAGGSPGLGLGAGGGGGAANQAELEEFRGYGAGGHGASGAILIAWGV